MKIRSGYVSNSSSSSFLVVYHDISNFIKFSLFDYFSRFLSDVQKSDEEMVLNYIKYAIVEFLHSRYDGIEHSFTDFEHFYSTDRDNWVDMVIEYEYQDTIVDSIVNKMIDMVKTASEEGEVIESTEHPIWNKVYHVIHESSDLITEEATKFMTHLKDKGHKIAVVIYGSDVASDDDVYNSELHSYLETKLLPMMTCNPDEDKFRVYSQSHH